MAPSQVSGGGTYPLPLPQARWGVCGGQLPASAPPDPARVVCVYIVEVVRCITELSGAVAPRECIRIQNIGFFS